MADQGVVRLIMQQIHLAFILNGDAPNEMIQKKTIHN